MENATQKKVAQNITHEIQQSVEQFLYQQSELLDAKRWQDYIDLFTDDGVYWMPANADHEHWEGVPSIFIEDKNTMTIRMKRVLHPEAWSQVPIWETNHIVGNVVIQDISTEGDIVVRSRFQMIELRREDVRHFAGRYLHVLKKDQNNSYLIEKQRVDMFNAQATYEFVLQVWV